MQIKTITNRIDNNKSFDIDVNEALSEGWVLVKRYILEGKQLSNSTYSHNMLIAEMIKPDQPVEDQPLKIKIKYFDQDIEKIQKISVGDWIDLRASRDVELFEGDYALIPLGVGMILPDGYEAHILPRSSTPDKFGIMCANSMGVIDNSYSGDSDQWHFPAVALRRTTILKGDRIAQFRIIKNQPSIEFEIVDHLNEISRGGIGSTGKR